MIFESDKPIQTYSNFIRQGILLDTSPLIIYFLGEYDKNHHTSYLEKFSKGTKNYSFLDYDYLKNFLNMPFEKLCITPHIFHEFYKHIQKLIPKNIFNDFFNFNIDLLMQINEESINKNDLMTHHFFDKLEIGEHSLYLVKEDKQPCVIITDDERKMSEIFLEDKEVLLIFIKDIIKHMNNL